MMKQPLVSIILTSYNQPELLKRAFGSLVSQTYENIEIIIVDDCSTDTGNRQLIERWKKDYSNIVSAFYQTQNIGIPANKNTGFKLAKGDYITYLDGDDTYYEDKIASEIASFEKHPDADVVYSNFDIKNLRCDVLSVWSATQRPEGYIFKDIILHHFPDSHTHRYELFKRHVLYDLNFYDEHFSVYHDLDFMLRYSLKYRIAYNNYVGSSYYKNPESIVSKTKGLKLIEQQQKVYEKYTAAIKDNKLERQFQKRLNQLQLDKLFYLKNMNCKLLFKAFLQQPFQLVKIAKIANFLYKTKSKKISNNTFRSIS